MGLPELFKNIGLTPKNKDLYYEALTHTSFVNEKRSGSSYQRLEFVGDALIDSETAIYIFNKFKNLNEGDMTVIRANVVNTNALAKHTQKLGLEKLIRLGKGAEELRKNAKVQADLFESLCAAIYIDLGLEDLRMFLGHNVFKDINETQGKSNKNPKTILQELLQVDSRENVIYNSSPIEEGFIAEVLHSDIKLGYGEGDTKKEAEVNAALSALEKFERGKNETN